MILHIHSITQYFLDSPMVKHLGYARSPLDNFLSKIIVPWDKRGKELSGRECESHDKDFNFKLHATCTTLLLYKKKLYFTSNETKMDS